MLTPKWIQCSTGEWIIDDTDLITIEQFIARISIGFCPKTASLRWWRREILFRFGIAPSYENLKKARLIVCKKRSAIELWNRVAV